MGETSQWWFLLFPPVLPLLVWILRCPIAVGMITMMLWRAVTLWATLVVSESGTYMAMQCGVLRKNGGDAIGSFRRIRTGSEGFNSKYILQVIAGLAIYRAVLLAKLYRLFQMRDVSAVSKTPRRESNAEALSGRKMEDTHEPHRLTSENMRDT